MSPDESFWIGAKGGLVREKHWRSMGDAVWLFLWLVLKQTDVSERGEGIVNYGHPQTRSGISRATGFPAWQIKKWMARLRNKKYIRTVEVNPLGVKIFIQKAKSKTKRLGANQDRANGGLGANQDRVPVRESLYYRESSRVTPYQESSIPKDLLYYNKDAAAKSAAVPSFAAVAKKIQPPRVEKSPVEIERTRQLLQRQAEKIKKEFAN